MTEYQEIWNEVKDILKKRLAPQTFDQTFEDVNKVVKQENGVVYVLTPSNYIKRLINNTHMDNINKILKEVTNKNIRFKFVCEDEVKDVNPINPVRKYSINNLNLNYTFESFVIGESNRMAYLSATKVADEPGTVFNPLYIFGGVGLGKTHLMQAIGNYISDLNVENKILYVQADEFMQDFVKAQRLNNYQAFEEKYEDIDVLLIDDIQMLADRNSTQQQFFSIFNRMDTNHKQIVITSDRPANKLNGFMERLTSRFQKGLAVNINVPDKNQRMQILKKKALELTTKNVPDDVLDFIAENFVDNVRELEGALNSVLQYCIIFNDVEPNLKIAQEALQALIESKKPTDSSSNFENALSVIAKMYNVTISDILGTTRSQNVVLPRHISMYILKTKYNLTYKKIGSILNGRDHTTIMNGFNKIQADMENNEELRLAIDSIMKKL